MEINELYLVSMAGWHLEVPLSSNRSPLILLIVRFEKEKKIHELLIIIYALDNAYVVIVSEREM